MHSVRNDFWLDNDDDDDDDNEKDPSSLQNAFLNAVGTSDLLNYFAETITRVRALYDGRARVKSAHGNEHDVKEKPEKKKIK